MPSLGGNVFAAADAAAVATLATYYEEVDASAAAATDPASAPPPVRARNLATHMHRAAAPVAPVRVRSRAPALARAPREFLDVPSADSETVGELGAAWDATARKWFIPTRGVDHDARAELRQYWGVPSR